MLSYRDVTLSDLEAALPPTWLDPKFIKEDHQQGEYVLIYKAAQAYALMMGNSVGYTFYDVKVLPLTAQITCSCSHHRSGNLLCQHIAGVLHQEGFKEDPMNFSLANAFRSFIEAVKVVLPVESFAQRQAREIINSEERLLDVTFRPADGTIDTHLEKKLLELRRRYQDPAWLRHMIGATAYARIQEAENETAQTSEPV